VTARTATIEVEFRNNVHKRQEVYIKDLLMMNYLVRPMTLPVRYELPSDSHGF